MKIKLHYLFVMLALLAGIHQAAAQGTTAFTYQGQLHDGGTNANGAYTMIFKLYDSSGGNNQIGSTITISPTLANGLFTVNLDFGNVFNGAARWLDITVTNGGTAQTLSPRVQVLPTPYAQFAATAASAAVAMTAPNGVSLGGTNYIPNIQVFGSSGTFVVPAGVTRIEVVMWGGGGGGGGGYESNLYTNATPGGGGGAGCYALNVLNVTPGSSYPVTIGSGGSATTLNLGQPGSSGSASSFGALMTANGGGGGSGGPNTSGFGAGAGGSGASCTGAIANFHSQDGQSGSYASGSGGNGASAWAAGLGGWGGNGNPAESGEGPGAGGGGGAGLSSSNGREDDTAVGYGAAGNNGAVFVYY
jgi:hypothetical protein